MTKLPDVSNKTRMQFHALGGQKLYNLGRLYFTPKSGRLLLIQARDDIAKCSNVYVKGESRKLLDEILRTEVELEAKLHQLKSRLTTLYCQFYFLRSYKLTSVSSKTYEDSSNEPT